MNSTSTAATSAAAAELALIITTAARFVRVVGGVIAEVGGDQGVFGVGLATICAAIRL